MLELAELSELDFASWRLGDGGSDDGRVTDARAGEAPDTDGAGVLTFERLLQLALLVPGSTRHALLSLGGRPSGAQSSR